MRGSSSKTGIIEVARLARVSPMTVTRTLNNSAPVAEKTRKIVLEAAERLGYKPNPFASALRGCKTKSVGIIWSLCGPHSAVGIVREMAWRLHERGYLSYINDSLSDPGMIRSVLREYVDRRVDGLIFNAHFMRLLKDKEIARLLEQIPAVVTETPENHGLPCDKVILDYYKAMEDIVDHFAATGRKRPVMVVHSESTMARINVFKRRMEKRGMDTSDFVVERDIRDGVSIGNSFVEGLRRKYPRGKYPFDAVWAACDEGAAALVSHFAGLGLRVPEDVAVVGFNNNESSEYLTPPLASVERMNDKVVSSILGMLFDRMDNPEASPRREVVRMEFVRRKSAG